MKLKLWRGQTALVTGASSGIGVEFARHLAAAGVNLILTARREERLKNLGEELAGEFKVKVDWVRSDLGTSEGANTILAFLKEGGHCVDVLVNNAGLGEAGLFSLVDRSRALNMVQVNIASLVALTHGVLEGMRERGRGRIILVGSVNAFMAVPYFAVYSATKAFVRSFGEALGEECKGTGVGVTLVHPGATRTEFIDVAQMKVHPLIDGFLMGPGDVARVGLRAADRGAASVVVGVLNKITVFMIWLAPDFVVRVGVKTVFKRLR